jgi:hypothetical protein
LGLGMRGVDAKAIVCKRERQVTLFFQFSSDERRQRTCFSLASAAAMDLRRVAWALERASSLARSLAASI